MSFVNGSCVAVHYLFILDCNLVYCYVISSAIGTPIALFLMLGILVAIMANDITLNQAGFRTTLVRYMIFPYVLYTVCWLAA